MKVLITGANGQLGWELQRTVPDLVDAVFLDSTALDITDREAVETALAFHSPDLVINAAAYTAVDKAELEAERAFSVNRDGVANLAEAVKKLQVRILHLSTDFIFDGLQSRPYMPDDSPNPAGVYGKSKLAGEKRLLEITSGRNVIIVRTAWVYSSHGHNFVKTMLNLMASRDQLGVVADQTGTPTWANGLAGAIWEIAEKKLKGVFHWTDAGVASWYDFACAIQEEALAIGLLTKVIPILPLMTKDYPLPAKRPPYSVLDKTDLWAELGRTAPHWRCALRKMLQELT